MNLPMGSDREALAFPHFPTRQQAVVWRNWELAPPDVLAGVLQTTEANVMELADGMGLRIPPIVVAEWRVRGYCTMIRANWHLLPYPQLLALLGWSEDRLAFALREEDALWIKLGELKPRAEPVVYRPLTADQRRQTAWVKQTLQEHFPHVSRKAVSPPFAFLKDFGGGGKSADFTAGPCPFDLRMIYSYSAPYGDCLLHPELDPYPDVLLERLAGIGVNTVWLSALLCALVPWPADPSVSQGSGKRLAELTRLASRIAGHGLGLILYLNEPRALPLSATRTFEKHPEWKGLEYRGWDITSLCTSSPGVLDYVRDASARLFREAPDLAGVFTITMSESPTNCYSKGRGAECPRCSRRSPQEVVAEVNRAIAEGVHSARQDARVIVWTWGWEAQWEHAAVDLLPQDVELMCVSEWGLPLKVEDKDFELVDYSISRVGPSERSVAMWEHAARRGMKTVAKMQVNNSWELAGVPYIPVPDLVAEHLANLRAHGVNGLMLSWTLGGYPGGNLGLLYSRPAELAEWKFGSVCREVHGALALFAAAFRQFPFSCSVMYLAPHNVGPMNLLHERPTGYDASMVVGFPHDDLRRWRDLYSEELFEDQWRKLSEGWKEGLDVLERIRPGVEPSVRAAFEDLSRVATAAYCHFRSAYLQTAFTRRRMDPSADARQVVRAALVEEIELAKTLHHILTEDSRIGFEASNHYLYTVNDLREKILNCRWLLENSFQLR